MSKYANNTARGVHVSPGIYTKETDLTYAVKSLGITSLGIAGETVKGPAFEPILVENWREFTDYFGGTNPAKHSGSGFLKYELPYIAKSYLQQSNQLYVVRTLGLSGYNAGPAWAITAKGTEEGENMIIALLRSRGSYQKTAFVSDAGEDECNPNYEYDKLNYSVPLTSHAGLKPTSNLVLGGGCDKMFTTEEGDFIANSTNYGRFDITGWTGTGTAATEDTEFSYSVSLNPYDKNYIINVLGTSQVDGDAALYVEELYDVALQQLIDMGKITAINSKMVGFDYVHIVPNMQPCNDLLEEDEITLNRTDVGKRFLATQDSINPETKKMWNIHAYEEAEDGTSTLVVKPAKIGGIYQVQAKVDESGVRHYYYIEQAPSLDENENKFVNVLAYDNFFTMVDGLVSPVTCDLNNYKEQYRYASTPWVVSEVKGGAHSIEITKLFRFHTITDGDAANDQVKISIENIKPDDGLFDVLIRSFYDSDGSPNVLERYGKCNLVPGTSNYLGYKIGTYDGTYESKSKYVTVEINETDKAQASVPAGFLGYPVRDYNGVIPTDGASQVSTKKVKAPYLAYNTTVDEDIRYKKQYFGLSNLTGIDRDICLYKGKEAYDGDPKGLTPCFHLDSRIDSKNGIADQVVSVDGVTGYTWNTVNRNEVLENYGIEPKIATEDEMIGTIYEDVSLRKFTLVPYGGFDGWDVYRNYRSNTDDFKYNKYKGKLNNKSGNGNNFSIINDPGVLGLDSGEQAINSDFYAYLSAIRQFANPSLVDINVLATPGIDYVNNQLLTEEVISMIEDERADSIYVVTTPDKPFGASDAESEMYTAEEVVSNLVDTEIASNYVCTYYPNVKYLDQDNSVYVSIPATKDVVRNFALTDNTAFPWFAPAGYDRGNVDCVRAKKILKIEDEDTLYEGRINPIKTFAQDGVKIWGNKNLQEADTQMNRINARRLLLRLRKLISIACVKLIFEPNDTTVRQSFDSLVQPILENIRSNRGISSYRIEYDTSTESIERHELNVAIFIKIIPTLEWININFVITPEGVEFEDLV